VSRLGVACIRRLTEAELADGTFPITSLFRAIVDCVLGAMTNVRARRGLLSFASQLRGPCTLLVQYFSREIAVLDY
jgi:hypothetical protein